MVNYNDNYDPSLLKKIAKKCQEFSSVYDSPFANAGSLYASQDGLGDRICDECTHWNQGTCHIFLSFKKKYH